MPLPDFELGPLELQEIGDSEPAIAPASARVKVNGETYLFRACEGCKGHQLLFFRLDHSDAPIMRFTEAKTIKSIYQVLAKPDEPLPSLFEEVFISKWEEELPPLLRSMLDGKHWHRLLEFEIGQMPAMNLFLTPNYGSWMVADEERGLRNYAPHFSWSPHLSTNTNFLIGTPDKQMVKVIDDLRNDAASEANFAWHWMQKGWNEQVRSVAKFKNGDQDELIEVMRWMSQLLASDLSGEWPVQWNVFLGRSVDMHLSESVRKRGQFSYLLSSLNWDKDVFSPNVEEWLDIVHSHFLPAYDADAERFPVIKNVLRADGFYFQVEVNEPTQHERLEARLHLREWLEKNAISALLGEA